MTRPFALCGIQRKAPLEASLPDDVLAYVRRDFDASAALSAISAASDGDCYLVGGAVRDCVLSPVRFGDLDIMLPVGDTRVFACLDSRGVPFELNRRGNRRYRWGGLQIDLLSPDRFYSGHRSVDEALSFFDLRINAFAVHVASRTLHAPFGSQALWSREVGINWSRWDAPLTRDDEAWLLLLRLMRLLHNTNTLAISVRDAARLKNWLTRHARAKWTWVGQRFPQGKQELLHRVHSTIERFHYSPTKGETGEISERPSGSSRTSVPQVESMGPR